MRHLTIRFPWFTLYGRTTGPRWRCYTAMVVHELLELVPRVDAHANRWSARYALGVVPEVLITPPPNGAQYGHQFTISVTGASTATPYTLTLYTPNGQTKTWDIVTDEAGAYTQLYPINERGTYSATLTAIAVVDASVGTAKGV